jgi:hypothetical protein
MKNQTEGYVTASWQGSIPEKREGGQRGGKVKRLQSPAWLFMVHDEVNLRVFIH